MFPTITLFEMIARASELARLPSITPPPVVSVVLSAIVLRSMVGPGWLASPGQIEIPPPPPSELATFGSPAMLPLMTLLVIEGDVLKAT